MNSRIVFFSSIFISVLFPPLVAYSMQYDSGLSLDFESDNIKPRKNIYSEFDEEIKREQISSEAEGEVTAKEDRGYITRKLIKWGLKKNTTVATKDSSALSSNLQNLIEDANIWDLITQHKLWRYPQHILGYIENFSNDPGAPIKIYYTGGLLSKASKLSSIIIKNAHTHDTVKVLPTNKEIKMQPCYSFYGGGCRYSQSEVVTEQLPIGEYYFILEDENKKESNAIYFNVRPRAGEVLKKDVVVMYANFTWQAYNNEGGGNVYALYDSFNRMNTSNNLYSVSLNRPMPYTIKSPLTDLHHSPNPAHAAVRVLQKEGLTYRTISNLDLHRYPDILKEAKVLLIISHDEYWTAPMFKRVSGFVKKGGHIANFSGNLANWIVNENKHDIFVRKVDSRAINSSQLKNTGMSHWVGVNISKLFGVSYMYSLYPLKNYPYAKFKEDGISQKQYDESDGITILEQKHPIFLGTGFTKNYHWDEQEESYTIMYNEIDGIPLNANNNIDKRFRDNFPTRVNVLARGLTVTVLHYLPNYGVGAKNVGVIVESAPFDEGGRVISFASIGVGCLLYMKNEKVTKVFSNTIHYLLSSKHENFNSPRSL